MHTPPPKKRNYYISYLKGVAILFIILIHLIDWGDTPLASWARFARQIFYPGVVFFMATAGSVIYIAYSKYDDLKKPTRRLISRGLQLIGIYYLYNIIKFFVFDYSKEHFYGGYVQQGIFTLKGILTLKAYAVPIPILVTFGIFIVLSPILLWIVKRTKHPHVILLSIIGILTCINYILPLPINSVTNFLYARGNSTFATLLWLLPFLLGFYMAVVGFEKQKQKGLLLSLLLTVPALWYARVKGFDWHLDNSLHPLRPHAITISFAFMYALIYVFEWMEKKKYKLAHYKLAVLRLLGDYTLWLYVVHWIVIDVTIWIFSPRTYLVWVSVPILLLVFLWWKRKIIEQYKNE